MTEIYDILETCLQELDKGAEVESLLSRIPEHAKELRPILEASIHARRMAVSAPSLEVLRRSRAKIVQRTAELRKSKSNPRKRAIPIFQRLAISIVLAALFLISGTGLVRASSAALPGENLYPVKRSWEGLRLFFTFDAVQRTSLENEFENERLEEVSDLIAEGRHETIHFAGVYMLVNNLPYVSGVRIVISVNTQLPVQMLENGDAVVVTGRTNEDGAVEAESITLLPAGAVVPVGPPVEVESEAEDDGLSSPSDSGRESGSGSPLFQIEGVVDSVTEGSVVVNGQTGYLDGVVIDGVLKPGMRVEVEGYYAQDGRFIVTKIEMKDSGYGGRGNVKSTVSGSGSGGSGEDRGDDDDHGSTSGSGGGDDDD